MPHFFDGLRQLCLKLHHKHTIYYAEEVLAYLLCNGIPFVHRKAACHGRFLLFFIIDDETKEEIEATTRWQLSSEDGFGNDEVWSAIEKP